MKKSKVQIPGLVPVKCESGSILKSCYVLVLCSFVNVAAENISFCVQHVTDGAEFPPFDLGYGSQDVAMDGVGESLLSINDGPCDCQLSFDEVADDRVLSSADCFKGMVNGPAICLKVGGGGCLWNKCDHQH